MTVQINGTTGVDLVQDSTITSAKIVNGTITFADTQVGAAPSMVRLNTANGYGSTNTMIRRFTNSTVIGTDITYADSATLGASLTVNTSGVYAMNVSLSASAACNNGLSLDSTQLTSGINAITQANCIGYATCVSTSVETNFAATMYLAAGSVVRPHSDGNGTATYIATLIMTRVA